MAGYTTCFFECNHGKSSSSKYAPEVVTMRLALGTHMLYAPGDRTLRLRLMPTQARASIAVLEYATLGCTA
eukprot:2662923-Pleurochrysis_carterae.AAC.1